MLDTGARTVLEIGPGNGLVSYLLRRAGIHVETLDHDPALSPDHVASLLEIPSEKGAYEAVLCCQVLEHLPWDVFPAAMREVSRVARNSLVIGLPHFSRQCTISFHWPRIGTKRFSIDVASNKPKKFDGEHYWEIGRGITVKQVCRVFEEVGLKLDRSYRIPEYRYHHMFALSK
jgi:hypothetical protein